MKNTGKKQYFENKCTKRMEVAQNQENIKEKKKKKKKEKIN